MPAQPQAPTGAPRYQPQPAPSPTNSHYRMSAEQTLVQLQAIPENQRLQEPAQYTPAPQPASPVPPAPAPVPAVPTPPQSDTSSKKLRSRLLSDGGDSGDSGDSEMDEPDFHGPSDRRMRTDRRAGSGTGRRFRDTSADADNIDDEDMSFSPSPRSGGNHAAASGAATVAMGLVFAAFGAKVWLFMSYPALLTTSTQITVDQLASAVALIGTLWLAFNMNKKS